MTDAHALAPIVLVVEDEPLLRLMAVDLVEEAGFVSLEAADAAQAMALLETLSNIRILFTDIDLSGGADGLTLAATVRDRWPPVEIILTSGHLKPAAADLPDRSVFFPKPYSHARVIDTMRAMTA